MSKKIKTLLRYPGGKTKAIDLITPFVKDYDKIISPFIGGGSLEVHWAGNLNKEIIGYKFVHLGKMMESIRKGTDAKEAFEKENLYIPESQPLPGTGAWFRSWKNRNL